MCEAEEMSDLAPARIIYSPNKGTYKHVRALAIPPASAVISHDDHESDWSGQKDENKQEEDLHTRTYDTEPIEQPYKPYTYNNNDETIELTHEHTYDRTDTDSVRATASNDEVDGSDGVGGMAGSTSCRNRPLPPLPIPANKHIVVHAEMFGTVPLPSDEEYDNSQLQADGSSASESGLDLHELPGAPVDVFVSLSEAESTDTNTAVWNATGHRVDSDLSVDDLDILEFSDDLDLPEIPEILSDGHDVEDCCDVNDLMDALSITATLSTPTTRHTDAVSASDYDSCSDDSACEEDTSYGTALTADLSERYIHTTQHLHSDRNEESLKPDSRPIIGQAYDEAVGGDETVGFRYDIVQPPSASNWLGSDADTTNQSPGPAPSVCGEGEGVYETNASHTDSMRQQSDATAAAGRGTYTAQESSTHTLWDKDNGLCADMNEESLRDTDSRVVVGREASGAEISGLGTSRVVGKGKTNLVDVSGVMGDPRSSDMEDWRSDSVASFNSGGGRSKDTLGETYEPMPRFIPEQSTDVNSKTPAGEHGTADYINRPAKDSTNRSATQTVAIDDDVRRSKPKHSRVNGLNRGRPSARAYPKSSQSQIRIRKRIDTHITPNSDPATHTPTYAHANAHTVALARTNRSTQAHPQTQSHTRTHTHTNTNGHTHVRTRAGVGGGERERLREAENTDNTQTGLKHTTTQRQVEREGITLPAHMHTHTPELLGAQTQGATLKESDNERVRSSTARSRHLRNGGRLTEDSQMRLQRSRTDIPLVSNTSQDPALVGRYHSGLKLKTSITAPIPKAPIEDRIVLNSAAFQRAGDDSTVEETNKNFTLQITSINSKHASSGKQISSRRSYRRSNELSGPIRIASGPIRIAAGLATDDIELHNEQIYQNAQGNQDYSRKTGTGNTAKKGFSLEFEPDPYDPDYCEERWTEALRADAEQKSVAEHVAQFKGLNGDQKKRARKRDRLSKAVYKAAFNISTGLTQWDGRKTVLSSSAGKTICEGQPRGVTPAGDHSTSNTTGTQLRTYTGYGDETGPEKRLGGPGQGPGYEGEERTENGAEWEQRRGMQRSDITYRTGSNTRYIERSDHEVLSGDETQQNVRYSRRKKYSRVNCDPIYADHDDQM